MTQLSPHFTLDELTQSDTALRLGIDNTPPDAIVEVLRSVTAPRMEDIRTLLGAPIHVNVAYRCDALEKVLTERDYNAWCARRGYTRDMRSWQQYLSGKAHPKGYAVDYVCRGFGTPAQIVAAIQAERSIVFDQCIMEGTWVHTSFDPRARRQVLVASFARGVPTYSSM